jgi:CheY-like chemotaxis protein
MRKRVLFIEDEKFFLDQIQMALSDYDITPAYSAPEGIEIAQKEDFDAVLLDIMMPPSEDMDPEAVNYGRSTGVEVCKKIKELKPALPVIVLSVVRDTGILGKITEAGAIEVINKPASSSEVRAALDKVLGKETQAP